MLSCINPFSADDEFDPRVLDVAAHWPGVSEAGASALYRRARTLSIVRRASWAFCAPQISRAADMEDDDSPGGLEGHALCTWRNRFIICAGGWSYRGLDPGVYVVDTRGLAGQPGHAGGHSGRRPYHWVRIQTEGDAVVPTYGYSLTELSGDRIVKYGGA